MAVKYCIIFIALLVTACGGAGSAGGGGAGSRGGGKKGEAKSVPARVIEVVESIKDEPIMDTIDLGRLHAGEIISQELTLTNKTDAAMLILSVESSCGCTTVQFDKQPAQTGQSLNVGFEYDSKGLFGFQMKSVTINTSASSNPCKVIILAYVQP